MNFGIYVEILIECFVLAFILLPARISDNGPNVLMLEFFLAVLVVVNVIGSELRLRFTQVEGTSVLGIDKRDKGIWVRTPKDQNAIYIPFSLLISFRKKDSMLVLKYHAGFKQDSNGEIKVVVGDTINLRLSELNGQQFKVFVKEYNKLVGAKKAIDYRFKISARPQKTKQQVIGAFILFPLMILLVVFPNDFSDTGLDTTSKQAKKADEETTTQDKLQYGKVYSVEGYRFKINQGYYAKDTDGKNVVIFNIDIALSAESYEQHDVLDKFASKTLQLSDTADKVKEYNISRPNYLEIMQDKQAYPVVNLLTNKVSYGELADTTWKNMNLAYVLPEEMTGTWKLTYSEYDDRFINHQLIVKRSELEEIK